MVTPGPKHQLFNEFARVGKALGNPNRLELLELVAQGERSVEALSRAAGLSIANTSQHLQQLRHAGLVSGRKTGQHVYYRLADDSVVELMGLLRRLARTNLAEVERLIHGYLSVKDDLEPVAADELLQRLSTGRVTVVDVRPPEEYQAGHVAGALNIPLPELTRRLEELPADVEVVAYCRGPYCVLAYEAVAHLRASGYRARRLEDGYPEWRQAGLPIEVAVPGPPDDTVRTR